jgi:hypothetical protein
MTWLLAPSTDRLLARRFVARLDQILGYPRTLAESEITRRGPASQTVAAPRCETEMAVYVHSTTAGVTALRGVIAIYINDSAREALRERFIEHDGVRKRVREWIADQGWQVFADRPGVDGNWTNVTPRDGAAGSADGVPIPEGAE